MRLGEREHSTSPFIFFRPKPEEVNNKSQNIVGVKAIKKTFKAEFFQSQCKARGLVMLEMGLC